MALIRDGALAENEFAWVPDEAELPATGAVVVSVDRWQAAREELLSRADPVGVRMTSTEPPALIGEGLDRLALVELEFPGFRDGRAYSYARLLREKYGFGGELRAIGEVLLEQLHFMARTGFNAFVIDSEDPLRDFEIATRDFSVWYQPAADGRRTALELRRARP